MDLAIHYNTLYQGAVEKILAEKYTLDEKIDSVLDKRFGITLLIRPDEKIKRNIRKFINVLQETDSEQYYYPDSDIHITVMSIISCYEGFNLSKISLPDYLHTIENSLKGIDDIEIDFKGITASDSAIMIQGFPVQDSLNKLRNNLRENFRKSELEESIDKRYLIFTAHATVARFRRKIKDKKSCYRY